MGTRGLYGFRKNGVDKTTYNHWDSYPECLGRTVVRFCLETPEDQMSKMYDQIELVDEDSSATPEQIAFCRKTNTPDLSVGDRSESSWYCLLRNIQGDLNSLKNIIQSEGKGYMIDNSSFIKDSLFCEYAYIINLDDHILEYYEGFQKEPDEAGRYGCEQKAGYYPCKLIGQVSLNDIKDYGEDRILEFMSNHEFPLKTTFDSLFEVGVVDG